MCRTVLQCSHTCLHLSSAPFLSPSACSARSIAFSLSSFNICIFFLMASMAAFGVFSEYQTKRDKSWEFRQTRTSPRDADDCSAQEQQHTPSDEPKLVLCWVGREGNVEFSAKESRLFWKVQLGHFELWVTSCAKALACNWAQIFCPSLGVSHLNRHRGIIFFQCIFAVVKIF